MREPFRELFALPHRLGMPEAVSERGNRRRERAFEVLAGGFVRKLPREQFLAPDLLGTVVGY